MALHSPKNKQYQQAQDAFVELFDLKKGSKIKITRKAKDDEAGWDLCWTIHLDPYVGKEVTISSIGNNAYGIQIEDSSGRNLWVPFFIVEPAAIDNIVELDSGSYTAVIDTDGESVKVGCQAISFSTVESIYNKMKALQG